MSKLKTAEEILHEHDPFLEDELKPAIIEAIREGMRQGRDAALELASDFCQVEVDQLTVLELKEHPDLEIK